MTKTYLMQSLIEKMQSPDQDFRFMGLNDLMSEIKQDQNYFVGDENVENKVLRQVLALVEDKISEVKNQAVKCLGVMIKILRQSQMEMVVDKLIEFSGGKDDELRDISALALKTITAELPPDGKIAASACAKLTPKLLGQLQDSGTPPEALVETLSILSILISRFPGNLTSATFDPHPLVVVAPLLTHPRPVVRKRAIITISQFIPISQPHLVSDLMISHVYPNLAAGAGVEKQRTTVQLVSAVTRQAPVHIAPSLEKIVPGVLAAVEKDDEELREGGLQALESFLVRCPSEITPFTTAIVQAALKYIKYDPNYAGDDEDEEMADADVDEEEDDEDLDEYSDEEDTSYKIRRCAVKVLSAFISTRPETLIAIYKDISPALISRFGDREETVRLEVWATYSTLLSQTSLYGGLGQREEIRGGKRKRDEEKMDVEEGPYSLLKTQVPALSKALLGQLKPPKTSTGTLQAAFNLLYSLLEVLPGSLSAQVGSIATVSKGVLTQAPTNTTSALHLACLSFLSLFFSTHTPPSFTSALPTITPVLIKGLQERHPRVASESFKVFSSLLNAIKPIKSGEWVDQCYDRAVARLSDHDTDAEVRASAEQCIGDLWIGAPEMLRAKNRKEWEAICRNTGNVDGAVRVIIKVAKEVQIGDEWVNGCLEWLIGQLRKSGRVGKVDLFVAIDILLNSYTSELPSGLPPTLIDNLKPFLTVNDISLLSQALTVLSVLLQKSPATTFSVIEGELLPTIYKIAHSPLVSGAALDSVLVFLDALVKADEQIATHVIPNLAIGSEKALKGESSPANVARCIAQVVKSQQNVAAGTIAEYSKHIKSSAKAKPSQVALSLLIIGELGRFIDMSQQPDIFANATAHFTAEQEEARSAAAFAAGNIAIGNLQLYLPSLVAMIQSDAKQRLLALHALKEVVTHCPQSQLEGVADLLWQPLFANSESAEETTRNVASACLGKLATTHPSKYLPQLHTRIKDESPAVRATVVSAIRYTFADSSQSYEESLSPLLVDFLGLMTDQDLNVRRLALSTLNSAARTKSHLVREHLPTLLPNLYKETVINKSLIRTVQMGPWTQRFDDGLEARKTAFETLYTLLDTCIAKIDLHEFLGHLIPGLEDDNDEIKVICHMILFRLAQVAPSAVGQRLDDIAPQLAKTLKTADVTKDTVKQDLERSADRQRSALRALVALSRVAGGVSPKFDALVEEQRKKWGTEFKELGGA